MKTRRKKYLKNRRGLVTLDYIIVLAITFPAAWLLFGWLRDALVEFYKFATVVINWPYL